MGRIALGVGFGIAAYALSRMLWMLADHAGARAGGRSDGPDHSAYLSIAAWFVAGAVVIGVAWPRLKDVHVNAEDWPLRVRLVRGKKAGPGTTGTGAQPPDPPRA